MFLFLFGKTNPLVRLDPLDGSLRIRCPRCQWQPRKEDSWVCDPGCGHVWNTFDTQGLCPGCGKQWHETSCHRCSQWSPHEDWYEVQN